MTVDVPTGTASKVTAKLYVQDSGFAWHQANATTVTQRGSWLQLRYLTSGYLDAVTW